ncbi:LysR family transcriptional regulator [Nonomuraea longicatena]|uniref:LysR family transcriptional regulator n=1 Tax=Nonomuraea longicatena TaxID=83682 RepID=A0ABP4AF15_9ACTN
MDRRELEVFLVLADELHFGRTAERLRLSQGNVSQTLRKLERRIGAPLFERTSRQVTITAIGERLRQDITPAARLIRDGLARATAAGRGLGGPITVGFVGAAMGDLLARAGARHPEFEAQLREIQIGDGLAPLRAGEIDLMAGPYLSREPGLITGPVLLREPRMLAVPSDHRLARQESVCLEDLASASVLTLGAASWPDSFADDRSPSHTPGGREIPRGPEVKTFSEALTLITAGKGVIAVGAQANRYYAWPGVTYVPFRDAAPVEWALVWRAASQTVRVREFARAVAGLATVQSG